MIRAGLLFLLLATFVRAGDYQVVELPSPNSSKFSFEVAEERKLEILENFPSQHVYRDGMNMALHIRKDDTIELYHHPMLGLIGMRDESGDITISRLDRDEANQVITSEEIHDFIVSVPVASRFVHLLITSDLPLKESKSIHAILNQALKPGVQIHYLVENQNIEIDLHFSDGLSAASTPRSVPQLILFREHTHCHFKIRNRGSEAVTLFQPNCPPGDQAMRVEFRDPKNPDKIFQGQVGHDYTGGMGIPKVFDLQPDDDLIVNLDFLGYWQLPFVIEAGQVLEMEVRLVYESYSAGLEYFQNDDPKWEQVWKGRTQTKWQKVEVVNRSGKRLGKQTPEASELP